MVRRNFIPATCHPDRLHKALGMCSQCYLSARGKTRREEAGALRCASCRLHKAPSAFAVRGATATDDRNSCHDCAGTKTCNTCGITKAVEEFSWIRRGERRVGRCKPCSSERVMARNDVNPDGPLDSHLRRKFGISLAEFNRMRDEQGNRCAICGEPPTIAMGIKSRRQGRAVRPRLVVDHCHETGRIRGLLCTPCNRGIGFLGDDPKRVLAALHYLESGS